MFYTTRLKPFSDFWQDCTNNNMLSMITTYEPSYKYMAYLNNYELLKLENQSEKSIQYVQVNHDKTLKKSINMIEQRDVYFKDDENFLNELNGFIKDGQIVWLSVDMFYMIPETLTFGMRHAYHYSIITGFDDERQVYYTFEYQNGYKIHEIPKERLVVAYRGSTYKEPPAKIMQVSKDIEKYHLNLNEIVENAKRLKNEIPNVILNCNCIIDFNNKDFYEIVAKCVFPLNDLVNRQIGNQLLFKTLLDLKIVKNESDILQFANYANELEVSWKIIRNNFMKQIEYWKCGKRDKYFESDNSLYNHALDKERLMWDKFIQNFS